LITEACGGFDEPEDDWYWNKKESPGTPMPYLKGLNFVIGFRCSWLQLEKIQDTIIDELFEPPQIGPDKLPNGVDARLLYLKFGPKHTFRQIYHIIDKLRAENDFTTKPEIPGWWREEMLYTVIHEMSRYLHKYLERNSKSDSQANIPITPGEDIYPSLHGFARPPQTLAAPDADAKFDLEDCVVVIENNLADDRNEDEDLPENPADTPARPPTAISMTIKLTKLFPEKNDETNQPMINKANVDIKGFWQAIKEGVRFDRKKHEVGWESRASDKSIIFNTVMRKGDLVDAVNNLHVGGEDKILFVIVSFLDFKPITLANFP
jgi:hypothetical protein